MFFFKMIFDFSEQNYAIKYPRIDAIRTFVFGSAAPDPITEPKIRSCMQLYKDFSEQDTNVPSIKAGRVSAPYVETMFRRMIGEIASLLQLRKRYFQR